MNTGLGGWMPISRHLKKFLPIDRPYTELEAMYSLQLDYHDGNEASEAGYASLWGWSRTRVRNFLSNASAEISEAKNQRSLGKVLSSFDKTGTDTGRGQAPIQAEDRQRTGRGQARLINISKLDDTEDRQRTGTDTGRGQAPIQAEDRHRYTTIERGEERVDITTTPLPPAGGSGKGEERGAAGAEAEELLCEQSAPQEITARGQKSTDGSQSMQGDRLDAENEKKGNREGLATKPPSTPLETVADQPILPEQIGKKKRSKLIDEGVVFFRGCRPEWITTEQWEEIIHWRVRGKVAMTKRAADNLIREIEKSRNRGYTVDQILDLLSKKPWSSYEDRYLDNQQMQPVAPRQSAQGGAAPRPMPDSRELAERLAQERYEADMRQSQPKNEQEGG